MRRSSAAAVRVPLPPATTSVSIGPAAVRSERATSSNPFDVRSGPAAGATSETV